MQYVETEQIEGGIVVNPWTAGAAVLGMAYAGNAIYNFVNGVYTGIKDAYKNDK